MNIRSEQEALFMACAMENSAIRMYTRALQLLENLGKSGTSAAAMIRETLQDEHTHLCTFTSLRKGHFSPERETALLLSGVAEGILFEGGLIAAARDGLLEDWKQMLRTAQEAEAKSCEKYLEFAKTAESPEAREALEKIAGEEMRHLHELEQKEINFTSGH